VVGVHTPEFSFEHELDRVRKAVTDLDIDYPVVLDGDYAIWSAFDNHYWPAAYFIDRDGVIRGMHFGEGRYEESERILQQLLGIEREPVSVAGVGVEAEADWENLRSPETYVGYARSERRVADDGARLGLNDWTLLDTWEVEPERVVLSEPGGSISYRFHARDAYLVLSPGERSSIPFRVLLDGEAPGSSHGIDIDEDGNGLVEDARLYQLVRQGENVTDRTLNISFADSGVEAYVFTFG
jgi:hypothetical protein